MSREIKWYGWKRDIPDFRDMKMMISPMVTAILPRKQINMEFMPEVFNQGAAGSCTGQSAGGACKYILQRQNAKTIFTPSRLFIYYNGRSYEGTTEVDNGSQIRDVIKGIAHFGFCHEETWPYDITMVTTKPSSEAYVEGLTHQALTYARVSQNLQQLKGCIASGYTFIFGFSVFDSFESDEMSKSGILPMPKASEGMIGGHAVYAFGYDDDYVLPWGAKGVFYIRNSWGENWGLKGNFLMPYDYILNPELAADFWNVELVEM